MKHDDFTLDLIMNVEVMSEDDTITHRRYTSSILTDEELHGIMEAIEQTLDKENIQ
jgi:hypothetical protein